MKVGPQHRDLPGPSQGITPSGLRGDDRRVHSTARERRVTPYADRMPSSRTDEDRLRLFVDRVERIMERRAVKERTIQAHFNLTANQEGTTMVVDLGDDEDMRSLLLDIRMFLADREDIVYRRISNILSRRLTDDELRDANEYNRKEWERALRGQMSLVIDEKAYTSGELFDLVVNGEIFHNDEAKAAEFEAIPDMMKSMALVNVNSMIIELIRIVHHERNVISRALATGALDLT